MERMYGGTSAYKLNEYERYAQSTKQKQKKRAVNKHKFAAKMCKRFMVAVIASFLIGATLIYTNVVMIRSSSKVDKLTKQLAVITEQNKEKELELNKKTNIATIEETAINELGMQRPDNSQIVYVNVKQPSYTEHPSQNAEKTSMLASVKEALSGIVEYFR